MRESPCKQYVDLVLSLNHIIEYNPSEFHTKLDLKQPKNSTHCIDDEHFDKIQYKLFL